MALLATATTVITDTSITTTGSYLEMYNNTVTVAKKGADFTTIQGAIDSITVGTGMKYNILIYPGVYNEDVVLKNGVNLQGMGGSAGVVINGTSATLTMGSGFGYPRSHIRNLIVKMQTTGTGQVGINCSGGIHIINDVTVDYDVNNGNGNAVNLENNCFIVMRESAIQYDQTGTGGGDHIGMNTQNEAIGSMSNSAVLMDIAGVAANDRVTAIGWYTNTTEDLTAQGNTIDIVASSANFGGLVAGVVTTSDKNTTDVRDNHIHLITPSGVSGSRGTAYVIYTDGGGELHATANRILIDGFDNNFVADAMNASNVVISHFDDIVAVNGSNGTGSYVYVNSPVDGNLWMNGDMHATYVEFDDPSNTYIGRDKTFPDYFAFANDYTNFWLGYTGDRNIWMNYDVKADIIMGQSGDTDIEIYNGSKSTELDQHDDDFWVTLNTAGDIFNLTQGDMVIEAGYIKADTFVSSNGSTGLTLNITTGGAGSCWQYYEDGLLIAHNCTVN